MNLRILLILGALSAFGPLAIDFYLPSFPTLAKAFATDVEHVQLSLAAYFAGLSIGQLLYGPVADRYGRRLPLLVGGEYLHPGLGRLRPGAEPGVADRRALRPGPRRLRRDGHLAGSGA